MKFFILLLTFIHLAKALGPLIFSEEFNYNGPPDPTKWNTQQGGGGWGNNELQFYTDQNAYVKDGVLTIETRKQNWGGNSYTSSRLNTIKDFKYGVFEMRAKIPSGRGSWPAFWLLASKRPLNWPTDGEIDILEHVGYDPGRVHANIHCQKYNHVLGTGKGNSIVINDPFNTFHTYKLDWNAQRMIFYVDDKQYFVYTKQGNDFSTWPFDMPENIIINTAVGGNWGGAQGVDDSIFPIKFIIDYIRVWQNDDSGVVDPVTPGNFNWQSDGVTGKWSMGCDFPGNDFANVVIQGSQCSTRCRQTSGCTHYAWSNYNGGTCWLKTGNVNPANAIQADPNNVCGYL